LFAVPEPLPFIIWGSAGHAKVLLDIFALHGNPVIALFDNRPGTPTIRANLPIHYGWAGFQEWLAQIRASNTIAAAIAIGGNRGADRLAIANRISANGLTLPSIIHPTCALSATASYGRGCHFLAHSVVAADARLGEVCIVNHHATVDHECRLGDGVHVAPGATLCGCIEVGNHTLIGAGAVILPRIRIGANVIVGAGAVVTTHVPDGAVVVGNPARAISQG
jgi:sugar O-acyltransferase (sialic acid O-acetyltransferase NeuD family)